MVERMLKGLSGALRGSPAERLVGARLALGLAFGVLALPGLPLGLLYWLTRPAPLDLTLTAAFVGLALLLGALTLWLARRAATNPHLPREQRGLSAAMQAASAPAAAFLLGCVCFASPLAWGLLWLTAALLFVLAWRQLPSWLSAQPRGDTRA